MSQPVGVDPVLLQYCCDSVESCPISGLEEHFVVGTYELQEDRKTKLGGVQLCQWLPQPVEGQLFELGAWKDTEAVFDLKWAPKRVGTAEQALLGQVNADGSVLLWDFQTDPTPVLSQFAQTEVESSALSLAWQLSPTSSAEADAKLIVSASNGQLNLLQLAESELSTLQTWQAHEYETWISTFSRTQEHVVYSGADDCVLKGWDTRAINKYRPAVTNKEHTMGVTVILAHPTRDNMIVTGSYDEKVRVYDERNMTKALSTHSVGGGVWRLKWHPSRDTQLLVGAMHNGFHVLNIDEPEDAKTDTGLVTAVGHHTLHKSLAYGCDWSYQAEYPERVASCSFYDKELRAWRVPDHLPKPAEGGEEPQA